MSTNSLSPRPNFRQLQVQAKELLRAQREGEAEACARIAARLPRVQDLSAEDVVTEKISLQEVQHVLAREHGYSTWSELRADATDNPVTTANPEELTAAIDRGRFTVSTGRGWADLLTPINFYRMNVKGFGLDVVVQSGTEVVPGIIIYPQIMAACQLDGTKPRTPDGGYALSGNRPLNRDGVYDGPPSLIVEIFGGDEPWAKLMEQSQALLARAGVTEYIVDGGDGLLWFRLDGGGYVRVEPDEKGMIRSVALPGFWFNVDACNNKEHSRMFDSIVRGIESDLPEKYWSIYRA